MECQIFVYLDLGGSSYLVGRLWTRYSKGRESASFEYDPQWLNYSGRFALEPALTLGIVAHHTENLSL